MNTLQVLFTTILNMSVIASYVAVGVILVRLILRKSPKIFSYALWAVVLFRLICPLSFTSTFSFLKLLKINTQNNAGVLEYMPYNIGFMQTPRIQSGIGSIDIPVNSSLPQATPVVSINPMQVCMEIFSIIWLAGIIILFSVSVISYIKIKRRLLTATLVKGNIYESEGIGTAFVCGFVHPKIYVPVGISDGDLSYILEHEGTHIQRRDYLIKPLAFFALILHWFNPLMWLSFSLMSRDMEMSCDERVLQKISLEAKGGYSNSLLSLSVKRNGLISANPLAFGENHVKARIKNILNYKKPVFWVLIASIIILIVVGIPLISNPAANEPDLSFLNPNNMLTLIGDQEEIKIESSEYGYTAVSGRELAKWLDMAENNWKRKNIFSLYELSPSIIIHVNDDTINEIRFFEAEPNLAMIVYQDKFRYYKIPEEDYIFMKDMAGLGYPNVQSITFTEHENGNDAGNKLQDQIGLDVESNLDIIMSSPKTSSNPQDYIYAHKKEYEYFFKYGGEDALQYMLSQFEAGNAEGLRGQIMMQLCKELLGVRNNVTDESLSPREWYDSLSIRKEIKLPNFVYEGQDSIEALVYDTEIEKNSDSKRGGFMVVAPKIFGSYKEEDLLKVFVTTYSGRYKLFDKALSQEGGSIIPAAITYRKDDRGMYILEKYEQARDGSEFGPSIRKYSTMPVSGKEIPGLADKIFKHYGDYEDIQILLRDNLLKHLRVNGITDATLYSPSGKIEFSLSNSEYKP